MLRRFIALTLVLLATCADARMAGNVGRAAGSKVGAVGTRHRFDRFQMMLPHDTAMVGDVIMQVDGKSERRDKPSETKASSRTFEDELWFYVFAMDVLG